MRKKWWAGRATRRMIAVSLGVWFFGALSCEATIREIMEGQSPLPPAAGGDRREAAAILADFEKNKEDALVSYADKVVRITGMVQGFTIDYPLNHERDLFVMVGPSGKDSKESPFHIYVRFIRPQMQSFGYPANKKPKLPYPSWAEATRALVQGNTSAYYNVDLNCIAIYSVETLTFPAVGNAKPVVKTLSRGDIPLVSVGDDFDGDVRFEQLDANGTLIFDSTAKPNQN